MDKTEILVNLFQYWMWFSKFTQQNNLRKLFVIHMLLQDEFIFRRKCSKQIINRCGFGYHVLVLLKINIVTTTISAAWNAFKCFVHSSFFNLCLVYQRWINYTSINLNDLSCIHWHFYTRNISFSYKFV